MKRRVLFALASSGLALAIVACACAKVPETPPKATPEPLLAEREAGDAGPSANTSSDAASDARVPGLPMPQLFPHVPGVPPAR